VVEVTRGTAERHRDISSRGHRNASLALALHDHDRGGHSRRWLRVGHEPGRGRHPTLDAVAGVALGSRGSINDSVGDPGRRRDADLTATLGMREARLDHTAMLLLDGRVLVVGGANTIETLPVAELFDLGSGS